MFCFEDNVSKQKVIYVLSGFLSVCDLYSYFTDPEEVLSLPGYVLWIIQIMKLTGGKLLQVHSLYCQSASGLVKRC